MGQKIKVTKDGPYIVSGKLPLSRETVVCDDEGEPLTWKAGAKVPTKDTYSICRCGASKTKPFCDGSHVQIKFNGQEAAANSTFAEQARTIEGPNLILKDNPRLCMGAGFCHRKSGTWELTRDSDNAESKKLAIQQACDCPSGRLVACEKSGKPIEPKFPQALSLLSDPSRETSGPLWVKGGVAIESADGKLYEKRNRVTLCRCGASRNKPFCDGAHVVIGFSEQE